MIIMYTWTRIGSPEKMSSFALIPRPFTFMIRTPVLIVTIQQIVQDTGEVIRCWPACFVERRNLFPLQAKSKARQTVAQKSRWLHRHRVPVEAARWTSATDSVFRRRRRRHPCQFERKMKSVSTTNVLFTLSLKRIV